MKPFLRSLLSNPAESRALRSWPIERWIRVDELDYDKPLYENLATRIEREITSPLDLRKPYTERANQAAVRFVFNVSLVHETITRSS